jgi:hypothetical protein
MKALTFRFTSVASCDRLILRYLQMPKLPKMSKMPKISETLRVVYFYKIDKIPKFLPASFWAD